MKRLTLFSKILLTCLSILITFGCWWLFVSIYYIDNNYVLLNNNETLTKENKRWYFFNAFKYRNIRKCKREHFYSIPLTFQIKNGKKYYTNLCIKCKIKPKFYKHFKNIDQYIIQNVQNDFYDYTCLLTEQDIYNKRQNHKLYIQDVLESKINGDLIEIQQISLSEISTN